MGASGHLQCQGVKCIGSPLWSFVCMLVASCFSSHPDSCYILCYREFSHESHMLLELVKLGLS